MGIIIVSGMGMLDGDNNCIRYVIHKNVCGVGVINANSKSVI